MANLFNTYEDMDGWAYEHIYFYDASLGTETDRGSSNTAFDYFDDTFAVGDALRFDVHSYPGEKMFQNIKVNVGTAIAATSYSGKWQCYRQTAGWTDITVTDNTNGFSVLGSNTITFNISSSEFDNWRMRVQYVITAVNTPTEGGANITDKVQLGNATIEIDQNDTLEDVYDDDVAGSWNAITKIDSDTDDGRAVYATPYWVTIKSGGTITMNNAILEMWSNRFVQGNRITVKSGGTLLMGSLDGNGYTKDGADIIANRYSETHNNNKCVIDIEGTFTMYGSHFLGGTMFYNFILDTGGASTFKDCDMDLESQHFSINHAPTIDNLLINSCARLYPMPNAALSVTGLKIKWITDFCQRRYGGSNDGTWTDCELTFADAGVASRWLLDSGGHDLFRNGSFSGISSNYGIYGGILGTQEFRRQYSVDVDVEDEDGTAINAATVELKDTDGNVAFSVNTAADGAIAQQWVTAWMCYDGGTDTNPDKDYNDFKLTITKAGYRTYQRVLTVNKPIDLKIGMATGDTVIYDSQIYDSVIY